MTEFIALLSQYSWLFILLAFLFSATIGSFLNVVIHRLPVMMKREWQQECNAYLEEYQPELFKKIGKANLDKPIDSYPESYNLIVPGSSCPKCGTHIKPWHNLPVMGWIILGGKCAACKARISSRYPIVEAFTGLTVATLAWHFGPTWQFVATALLTFGLIAMSGIDLDEMLLPDSLTLPLLWLGLLLNYQGLFTNLEDALIGAVAGYLSLWSVYWLFKLTTGKEGMGYGDFKLMALFGAWLGWQMLPLIILLSSLVGAVVGILMMVWKSHKRENPIPFGPYIAAAGWIALLWGQDIVSWYLGTL
ncbi:prepilin peptidase [Shewanella zhangzhouensis]|uniref:prepilin peptidase n=1 Tax=Shewanella zhangzhouensis TaxID=2864213 RepID=UPI001C65A51B|nr:A24 family peptidase [Shewanella zhangzhouensis]QYK05638.1 A24 family peptidase [Shewanella zhangzhouensis]